jgi:hypothetical protein
MHQSVMIAEGGGGQAAALDDVAVALGAAAGALLALPLTVAAGVLSGAVSDAGRAGEPSLAARQAPHTSKNSTSERLMSAKCCNTTVWRKVPRRQRKIVAQRYAPADCEPAQPCACLSA